MCKMMIVECDLHQTRVALFEEDRLVEVQVESRYRRSIVGNIYKGRVNRVLPGMQAAFVDIGLDRDAFLFVDDVEAADDEQCEGAHGAAETQSAVETLSPEEGPDTSVGPARSIDDLLDPGQELVVQVTKEPWSGKGARVTAKVALPGRYLVLLPAVSHIGISRRIEEESERERLRQLAEEIRPAEGGLILRTEAMGKEKGELERDLNYLISLWPEIQASGEQAAPPHRLHQELDVACRMARDLFSKDFSRLWVDDEETSARLVELLGRLQPDLAVRVELDRSEGGLERFGVEEEIEAALEAKVWLRSGGYIVIDPTEALVAIDVNTGRYVGKSTLEETVVRTNLEAIIEIVRQIRLRDLGGIIVIDLIDMTEEKNRQLVFATLEEELAKDPAKTKVLGISEFGLVEMTRRRSRFNLKGALTRACSQCRGSGSIKSVSRICLELRRAALRQHGKKPPPEILLRVNPEIAAALQGDERDILDDLESRLGRVILESDSTLHPERFLVHAV